MSFAEQTSSSQEKQKYVVPFVQTTTGSDILNRLRANAKRAHPALFDELLGTAEGAGVNPDTLFAAAAYVDLIAWLRVNMTVHGGGCDDKCAETQRTLRAAAAESCTDVFLADGGRFLAAHNEDANPASRLLLTRAGWLTRRARRFWPKRRILSTKRLPMQTAFRLARRFLPLRIRACFPASPLASTALV